jgi:hypothetical protein
LGEFSAVAELDHQPLENTGEILQDLIVPEADNAPPTCFEPRCAPQILRFSPTMLPTIYLDNERSLDTNKVRTNKVRYVRTDRHLPAEAISTQLLLANILPSEFRVGRIATQPTRAIWPHRSGLHQVSPTLPSPASGGGVKQEPVCRLAIITSAARDAGRGRRAGHRRSG